MNGRHVRVRRLLAGALAGLATAVCLVLPVAAGRRSPQPIGGQTPQPPELKGGARLYIAAARDSRLFTLCPPPGWPTARGGVQPVVDGVALFRMQRGTQDLQSVHVWQTGELAMLLPPPGGGPTTGRPLERVELDWDLPAWDEETAAAIAREVNKRKEFRVVESADDADDVLLVEAQHATVASFSGRTETGAGMISGWGGDREANFLEALFAVVVPAEEYRKHGVNINALLAASLWDGTALANRSALKPSSAGLPQLDPASAESLVKQLHDRTKRPYNFPPLCAASLPPVGNEAAAPIAFRRMDAIDSADLTRPARSADHATVTPTFRAGVTYVSVPVVVRDTAGHAVAGLTDSDFRVYEDDKGQKIDRLLTMSAAVNLALVVDTSSSMRLEWNQLQTAIRGFIETLRPDDRVLLASFDDRLFVQAEFTSEHGRLQRAVSQMDRREGTRLYDAIALVVRRRMQAIPDRTAIVLLTDGVDTRSRLEDAESTKVLISESHVPVYVIQYDTRRSDYSLPSGNKSGGMTIRDMVPTVMPEGGQDNTQLFMRADSFLAAMSDLSGGRLYHAETLRNLNEAFAQIARDLGEQYALGYYPANQARDGKYRSLRVEVNRPNVQVRARAGYRAASRQPGAR